MKYAYKTVFLLSFMLMQLSGFPSKAIAAQSCQSLLSVNSEKNYGDFLSSLFDKINDLDIEFKIDVSPSNDVEYHGLFRGEYEITLLNKGAQVGGINLARSFHFETRVPVYNSHISIHDAYKGKGIGSALYLLAARFAKLSGGLLMSTTDPHHKKNPALAVWERFVDVGLAVKVTDPFMPDGHLYPPSVFIFSNSALDSIEARRFDSLLRGAEVALEAEPVGSFPVPNWSADIPFIE